MLLVSYTLHPSWPRARVGVPDVVLRAVRSNWNRSQALSRNCTSDSMGYTNAATAMAWPNSRSGQRVHDACHSGSLTARGMSYPLSTSVKSSTVRLCRASAFRPSRSKDGSHIQSSAPGCSIHARSCGTTPAEPAQSRMSRMRCWYIAGSSPSNPTHPYGPFP